MQTPVFLTIDTEVVWRHHAALLPPDEIVRRSLEPAGVGVSFQLRLLAEHELKACFFVDPMAALVYGLEPVRRIVATILAAGQEVQLHLHTQWTRARMGDPTIPPGPYELCDYGAAEQQALIAGARDLLVAAGAPPPVAFRAGSYGGNDDTCAALAVLGIAYDSSHNGSADDLPCRMTIDRDGIAPLAHHGVVEVPVTTIVDGTGARRHFQICALSAGEMRGALDHAAAEAHAAVTIVGHGFELANRAGTRPNILHVRRFAALCRMLAYRREAMPTCHFADRPPLRLGQDDRPLHSGSLRTRWRQAEQLLSNVLLERAA